MKSNFKLALGATVLSASILSSCGMHRRSHNGSDGTTLKQLDLGLVGAWDRGCEKYDILGIKHRKVKLDFSPTLGYIREQTIFSDHECKGEEYVEKQTGSWAYTGDGSNGARLLNMTIEHSYVNPRNEEVAKEFAKTNYCETKDWTKGKDTRIDNAKCLSAFKDGQVLFEIYKTDDNKLTLGSSGFFLSGKTDDSRPVDLDDSRPYIKR